MTESRNRTRDLQDRSLARQTTRPRVLHPCLKPISGGPNPQVLRISTPGKPAPPPPCATKVPRCSGRHNRYTAVRKRDNKRSLSIKSFHKKPRTGLRSIVALTCSLFGVNYAPNVRRVTNLSQSLFRAQKMLCAEAHRQHMTAMSPASPSLAQRNVQPGVSID